MAVVDIQAPYSRLSSFLYDRLVAPAVLPRIHPIEAEWVEALPAGARVLDVGCGGGQVATHLARQHAGYGIIGVDLSEDQVRRASRRSRDVKQVRFQQASALSLPFPDAHFDGVYSIASIKHWPDMQAGAAECARVLKPGGRLCLVEVERGTTVEEAYAFVRSAPASVGPLSYPLTAVFMALVSGRGLHIDEARALAESLPLESVRIERLAGAASLVLQARRR